MVRAVNGGVTAQAAACIPLCCRALASQWNSAIPRRDAPVWQIRAAIKIFRMIAGVARLAQHRDAHLQQRCQIRPVRRMAVGAAVYYRFMLPQERAAFLCMARVTRLVDRLLHQ